ncbi:TlpA family protein disulfide reductase [Paludisphaera soli]|uniref:TlpA family protein disulfide reductase n=1 Tax=Paludisphaera soli TaxID=2712865 RepID=UPI0013E9DD54|nr:TlpA disulfide reductase family protein [Paludisphaera soli]
MTPLAPLLRMAVALGLLVAPGDDQDPEADAPGPRIAALGRRFEAREKAFYDELTAANKLEGDARQKKITDENADFQREWFAMADEVRALVRTHPEDPAALDGLILLTGPMRSFLQPQDEAIVRARFLDDPRIGKLCASLASRPESIGLIRDVADRHPDRVVRGQATYALACGHRYAAEQRAGGGDTAEAASGEGIEQAQRRFRQVVDEFADVRSVEGDFLLADRAKGELARFENLANLKVGKVAPEIVGEDLEGRPLKLSDHRGKVVVVCFWATWCGPCMAMVPHERELVSRLKGEPFALLGVNSDSPKDREKARKATVEKRMSWPSWWDGGVRGAIQTSYDVRHWPTVYVLDPAGVIRHIDVRGEELDRAVDALLAEMKAPPAPR